MISGIQIGIALYALLDRQRGSKVVVNICPKRVFRTLVYIIAALGLINLGITLLKVSTGRGRLWGIGGLFNAGAESNIPTWYSTFALLFAAVLAFTIAGSKRFNNAAYVGHWRGLSFLLLYLSLDEGCMIHERLGNIFLRLAHDSPATKMGWTAPFAVLILVVSALYIGFLKNLPAVIRRLFILSGALYVGSGLILELIAGVTSSALGPDNASSLLLSTIEEPGEMLGIAVLIHALLAYMAEHQGDIRLSISSAGT